MSHKIITISMPMDMALMAPTAVGAMKSMANQITMTARKIGIMNSLKVQRESM